MKTGSHRFLDATGVWTVASARVLRRPSVVVQVFEYRWVYVRPMSHREAARSKDEVGEFPVVCEVE